MRKQARLRHFSILRYYLECVLLSQAIFRNALQFASVIIRSSGFSLRIKPPTRTSCGTLFVQLQADRALSAQFWLRIGPVGDELSIDDVPNSAADCQDLHPVPVVPLSARGRRGSSR